MDFETPEEGYLAKIMVAAGQKDVKVGKVYNMFVSVIFIIIKIWPYTCEGGSLMLIDKIYSCIYLNNSCLLPIYYLK